MNAHEYYYYYPHYISVLHIKNINHDHRKNLLKNQKYLNPNMEVYKEGQVEQKIQFNCQG